MFGSKFILIVQVLFKLNSEVNTVNFCNAFFLLPFHSFIDSFYGYTILYKNSPHQSLCNCK